MLEELLEEFGMLLLLLLIAFGVGLLINFLVFRSIRFSFRNQGQAAPKAIKKYLTVPSALLLPTLIFSVLLSAYDADSMFYPKLTAALRPSLIFLFAFFFIRLVYVFKSIVEQQYDISKADNIRERKIQTQIIFLKNLFIVIISIVALSLLLMGYEPVKRFGAGLITSAGVTGIIIGFAAQRSIANVLAGFQIAFTQPIRIDDVVIVENEWGKIEEITLTYVVVKIWDKRRLVLPINYFIERPFQNWTKRKSDIMGSVFLFVDYTTPLQPLRDELKRLLEANPLWDGEAQVLQVTDVTEKSIQLRALMTARDAPQAWDLRCAIREGLIDFMQKNYPQHLPRLRAEWENYPS